MYIDFPERIPKSGFRLNEDNYSQTDIPYAKP